AVALFFIFTLSLHDALPIFYSRKLACLASMILVMLLYQAATAVVFAAPHYRYILPQVPFLIMLAALGVGSFRKLLSQRSMSVQRSEEHTSELQSPYDLVCRL